MPPWALFVTSSSVLSLDKASARHLLLAAAPVDLSNTGSGSSIIAAIIRAVDFSESFSHDRYPEWHRDGFELVDDDLLNGGPVLFLDHRKLIMTFYLDGVLSGFSRGRTVILDIEQWDHALCDLIDVDGILEEFAKCIYEVTICQLGILICQRILVHLTESLPGDYKTITTFNDFPSLQQEGLKVEHARCLLELEPAAVHLPVLYRPRPHLSRHQAFPDNRIR